MESVGDQSHPEEGEGFCMGGLHIIRSPVSIASQLLAREPTMMRSGFVIVLAGVLVAAYARPGEDWDWCVALHGVQIR